MDRCCVADARWLDVESASREAAGHFRNAAAIFDEGGFGDPGLAGYKASMAFMHAMQSGHTSMESALCRILDILGEERPTGTAWHDDLIRRVRTERPGSRPPILSPGAADHADETRRFRHLAMRTYGSFKASEAKKSVVAAKALARGLLTEVTRFKLAIDPPEAPPKKPPAAKRKTRRR